VNKKFSSAVNNIGMIWYEKKDYGRAIKEYQKALKINPSEAGTHANLGYAYFNNGKNELAFAEFHKALQLDPQAFEHNDRVGTMLEDRSVNNHGLFFFGMAKEYAKMGDAEHCAGYLRKALDEGYPDLLNAAAAPEFQKVIDDPMVQAVLALVNPGVATPGGAGTGAATPGSTTSTRNPPPA
jgi:tetratricopeptide (TPR) repeat protein